MEPHRIKDAAASVHKALTDRAGKVTLTLRSTRTGARLTYQASPVKRDENAWFLGLLTGPDNETSYSYIGMIRRDPETGALRVHGTRKGRPDSCPSLRGFGLLVRDLPRTVHQGIEVWHSGRCLRCNRTLTVPESIETGLGPVCAGAA